MHTVRLSKDRGHADFGWLDSRHTFSFGDYHDPRFMGFGPLRVINEDRVAPGAGFGTHSHRDMEILSWVLDGSLEHKDSLGTGALIRPGELQRMSAGTGVTHSEFNGSQSKPVHFLQIWLLPERRGLAPEYEQRAYSPEELHDRWRLIAARDGREGAVTVHQDADVYVARPGGGCDLEHKPAPGRRLWLQVARGSVEAEGQVLSAGDAMSWVGPAKLVVRAREPGEVLLFDMAP
ncbi:MAG TPA: pirin family protein [Steroidobacteraceae bacterium]|jgi:redox-sensitive bicupin YhaK (pirin superfamily)|nr:pirin family protein [Steroidobacteraceae bacterium]